MRPVVRFVYSYFLRLGFLDGRPGLIFCGLLAFYDLLASANRYEQQLLRDSAKDPTTRGASPATREVPRLAGSPR